MALRYFLVFVCCASLAIGLTLDNLPHRTDVPSAHHHLDMDPYMTMDGENDFIQRPSSFRRQSKALDPKYFSDRYGNDRDAYLERNFPMLSSLRDQVKREAKDTEKQLEDILKDDDTVKVESNRDKKSPADIKRQEISTKKKRESKEADESPLKETKELSSEKETPDFQDWLRREYYRNMAKSFASMRRKRAMWTPDEEERKLDRLERRSVAPAARATAAARQKKEVRFEEVTDNLKTIEDALLADALQMIKENGYEYEDDDRIRHRVTNDLNAAYDIETMRAALFRLRDTLSNMEEDNEVDSREFSMTYKKHKRGDQCDPLRLLTSDCATLGDLMPDESLKDLLMHACNWHEVCYTCGEGFGLNSETCDAGFVEQSHTVCHGDVPCETTARLLLLPLRQRRIFYKRSNPSICLVDPCVEEFLSRG